MAVDPGEEYAGLAATPDDGATTGEYENAGAAPTAVPEPDAALVTTISRATYTGTGSIPPSRANRAEARTPT